MTVFHVYISKSRELRLGKEGESDLTCPVRKSILVSIYQTVADALEISSNDNNLSACIFSQILKKEIGRTRYSSNFDTPGDFI